MTPMDADHNESSQRPQRSAKRQPARRGPIDGLDPTDAPSASARKIQQLLLGRWWLTIGVLVAFVAAGAIIQDLRYKPLYQSHATIQILPYKAESISLQPDARFAQNYESFMNTQATLLRSRPVLGRVLEENLRQDARYDEKVDQWTVDTLAASMTTEAPRRTQLISVNFSNDDPQLAQAVVDAVTNVYLDSLEQGLVDNDLHRLRQAEQRLGDLHQERDELNQKAIDLRMQLATDTGRLNQAQRQVQAASLAQQDAPAPVQTAEGIVRTDPRLRQNLDALAQAELEYTQMGLRFADRHPAMLRLAQRIEGYRHNIAVLQNQKAPAIPQVASTDVATAPAQPHQDLQALSGALARTEIQLTQLSHRLTNNQQQIDQTVQYVDQLKRESGLAGQISVVEPANLPGEPMRHLAYETIVVGGTLGGTLGMCLLIVLSLVDGRTHFPAQVADAEEVIPMGSLPAATPRSARDAAESVHRIRMQLQADGLGADAKVMLVAASQTGGGATTACVSLGASLVASGQRTLLIDTDVEKRWMSRRFGCAVVRNFEDVLRADGRIAERDLLAALNQLEARQTDLRKTLFELGYPVEQDGRAITPSMQHRRNQLLYEIVTEMQLLPMLEAQLLIQSCRNQPRGLFDAIEGMPLRHCITATDVKGLDLLPINDSEPRRYDSIGAEPMGRLLKLVSDTYDTVLIDAPSLDRSLAALLMLPHVDRSALVVPHLGSLTLATEAVRQFTRPDGPTPGILFNDFGRGHSVERFGTLVEAMLHPAERRADEVAAASRAAA